MRYRGISKINLFNKNFYETMPQAQLEHEEFKFLKEKNTSFAFNDFKFTNESFFSYDTFNEFVRSYVPKEFRRKLFKN